MKATQLVNEGLLSFIGCQNSKKASYQTFQTFAVHTRENKVKLLSDKPEEEIFLSESQKAQKYSAVAALKSNRNREEEKVEIKKG